MRKRTVELVMMLLLSRAGLAATHYADLNSTNPTPPYTNWATAAKVIQEAVDVAAPGDEIVVTNGIYATGGRPVGTNLLANRVVVDKPLTLRSVNGPEVTILEGLGQVRCIYLTNGASLCGFSLTHGFTVGSGGGVWCASVSAVVSNCIAFGNSARAANFTQVFGGGVCGGTLEDCVIASNSVTGYFDNIGVAEFDAFGGGAYGSTLNNCTLAANSANPYYDPDSGWSSVGYGGGACNCTLSNCIMTNNSADVGAGAETCILNNCELSGNSADLYGAGADDSSLTNCTLRTNSLWMRIGSYGGGGATFSFLTDCILTGNVSVGGEPTGYGGGGVSVCTLDHCVLIGNGADTGTGAFNGGGAFNSTLSHCTLSGNWAASAGGGADSCTLDGCLLTANSANGAGGAKTEGGGAAYSILRNCTLSGNTASYGGGVEASTLLNCVVVENSAAYGGPNYAGSTLNYCCTWPMPTNGAGNITNSPLFIDPVGGDLRLRSNSPCINAGNNAYAPSGPDLDGNPRIVGRTVDMGAYEFQNPASVISYAWLQQYGLPTDGSADYSDPDGDGLNDWQEWQCQTDPTNSLSGLRLLSPAITPTNATVTWQSVAGVNYFIQRSTNLAAPAAFATIATNVPGQAGTTTYTDTNAVGPGPFFYRVGVP